ncbi:MAG: hypothetical protein HFI68_00630 [Lachnospiraceae bacterium]|nr:hypothetical protein [Lachnospiraceae bacterium]
MEKYIKNIYRRLCFILAGVMIVLWILPVSASDEEVEEAKERVAAAEARAEDLQEAKERFSVYLEELNSQLESLETELDTLAEQRKELKQTLENTARELLEAKETEANQYEAMKKRIQYMYENRDAGFMDLIFSGDSLSSILNKAEYAMEMAEYDRNMLLAYQETKELVAQKEQALLTNQAELDRVVSETEEKQNEVFEAVAETTRKMEECAEELEDAEGELADYRAQLQQKELEAEERMARLAEEERRREEEENRKDQLAAGVGSNASSPGGSSAAGSSGADGDSSGGSSTGDGSSSGGGEDSSGGGSAEAPDEEPSDEFDYSAYSDLELLAAMIYREANMEPWDGKVAVGNVVMNRIASGRYPNSMIGVLSQPYQFTPWDGPKYRAALQNGVNDECTRAAQVAMNGSENYIGDLLHFRTIRPGYEGITIGSHVFY